MYICMYMYEVTNSKNEQFFQSSSAIKYKREIERIGSSKTDRERADNKGVLMRS